MRSVIVIASLWYLMVLTALPASAALLITEVHPNPLSGPEWVELYNDNSSPVDLNNWLLEDQLATPTTIHTFAAISLQPQTYLKIDLATQKLNNTADGVTLKDPSGTSIATMSYPSTTAGLSWSRPLNSTTYTQTSPTPGAAHEAPSPTASPAPEVTPNPTPSPPPNPAAYLYLQPSEIQACPETGEQEWLEVYNPTDYTLTLEDWHVKDNAENLRSVSATLSPHAFGSLAWSSGLLNNTGDSISLISLENETLFTATFGPCQKNTSYILDQNDWKLTTTITRNQVNRLTTPTPSPSPLSDILTSPAPETQIESPQPSILGDTVSLPTSSPSGLPPVLAALVATTAATTSLQLAAPVHHPFATNSGIPSLNLEQPLPNAPAILSVIMGGTVLLATHGLKLYRLYQHALAQPPAPLTDAPRVLFP